MKHVLQDSLQLITSWGLDLYMQSIPLFILLMEVKELMPARLSCKARTISLSMFPADIARRSIDIFPNALKPVNLIEKI